MAGETESLHLHTFALPLKQATVDDWMLRLKGAGVPPREIEAHMFNMWLEFSDWGHELSGQMEEELMFSTESNEPGDIELLAEIEEAMDILEAHAFNACKGGDINGE